MEKEIIALIKSLAGDAETLVIWYMVFDFVKHIIGWAGAIGCLYMFGRGVRGFGAWLKDL